MGNETTPKPATEQKPVTKPKPAETPRPVTTRRSCGTLAGVPDNSAEIAKLTRMIKHYPQPK